MRRGIVLLLLGLGCISGSVAASPAASSASTVRPKARITYVTPKVSLRGVVSVRLLVRPRGTRCTLALAGPYGHIIHLHGKSSRSGPLQWRYRMPDTVHVGRWQARASCGKVFGAGSATRSFIVGQKVLKANVAVVSDGFTQSDYGSGTGTFISYGAILHNTAAHVDALTLKVTASFTDTLGRSVASDSTSLIGVPAGATFYVGGMASSNISLTVASMNVSVSIGATQPHQLTLPPVTGLSLQLDGSGGGTVSGTIRNPYSRPTSSLAQIYLVYLDAQGAIVGGASEFSDAAITPGSTTAFGFDSFNSNIDSAFVPSTSIATVQGSMDPCGGIPGTNCPAQVPPQ